MIETSSRQSSEPVISTQLPEQAQEQSMQREYVTPEQDPEAVVGEAVHRLRTAIADISRMAADPVTREQVLRDSGNIQLASFDLQAVASFTRSRLPMEAA